MKRPEAVLETYFKQSAEKNGYVQYKFTSGVTGVPDRILIGNGLTVFVELKSKNGIVSKRQEVVIDAIRRHGGTVFVPFCVKDIDNIMTYIKTKGVV